MSNNVFFQMWGPFRQSLIAGHLFYVDEARKRLLSQFEGIEAEADKATEAWLEQSGSRFDPERDDLGDFYEAATQAGIEFYALLSDMRDQTCLSVVAGMFHEWDKQLRKWLVGEVRHWHRGDAATTKIWSADFGQIADLLEGIGWKICSRDYFRQLDACRLVVNVYKHGDGSSLQYLKENYPEYLDDPFNGTGGRLSDVRYRDHTHLKVSEIQFDAFSKAIAAFWKEVPENVFEFKDEDVPDWLRKALAKDHASRCQARKQ